MAYQNLHLEFDDNVAIITVNRPQARNALDAITLRELSAALDQVTADESVRALVVTGAGDRAFVAGADINELRELASAADGEVFAERGQVVFQKLELLPKPTIIAISGHALGSGLELALAGDIRLAAEGAQLGSPEINLGLIPGFGGTQRLPRLVGEGAAKFLIFTGEPIDALEAHRLGLVDFVLPAAELLPAAVALAKRLAGKAPVALALAKQAINEGQETSLERGCALEVALFGQAIATADRQEGTAAYLEKRQPRWQGR